MRAAAALLAATAALCSCATPGDEDSVLRPAVELIVAGSPVAAAATAKPNLYAEPRLPEGMEQGGGFLEQGWSMLGREDLAAAVAGADEYEATACAPLEPQVAGLEAVLDAIVARARDARVVIVNESHYITRHRDFSRRLIERLRPLGYSVFAAEAFTNLDDAPDPIVVYGDLPYPHINIGTYSSDPVFGRLVATARTLGYRLAAYERVFDPAAPRDEDYRVEIAKRERAQAEHLAAILDAMGPDEKLIVHVGYAHANERVTIEPDGIEMAWMAARLERMTGIDPLTISQYNCRGGGSEPSLVTGEGRYADWFDMTVDHPLTTFAHGRPAWRFDDGFRAVPIPAQFARSAEPLVIEAFADGDPFDAVPADRVYVAPGDDVRLALRPGRYVVRAVKLAD